MTEATSGLEIQYVPFEQADVQAQLKHGAW